MAKRWAGLKADTHIHKIKSDVEYMALDVAAQHGRIKQLFALHRALVEEVRQLQGTKVSVDPPGESPPGNPTGSSQTKARKNGAT